VSIATLPAAPAAQHPSSAQNREWTRARREELKRRYFRRPDAARTLHAHAAFVDEALQRLWWESIVERDVALVAVGGYGRGALFPHSDVDVLVLLPDGHKPDAAIERFIGALWDSGLEPGHSVRTVAECVEEATKDVTVDTSLMEARLIAGAPALLHDLETRLRERRDVREFFEAKFREQKRRHERFQEAAYNLEPNIKESPGGLRDLQMVLWLARAAGLGTSWKELADEGLITPAERTAITINERVLQDLRIRLHYLAGRREDRLVFDHQIEIARQLKLKGQPGMAPSDLLMRRYYLAAKAIWRFNQILLANLFERITPESERKPTRLDADFQIVSVNLDIRDEKLFEKKPGMILEAFLRLQHHRDIVGLGPRTLRALSRALPLINREFREERDNRRRFMQIMRSERLTWTLRRMSRYGVLGRYLPAFGRIVGQMQHDLFHVYTVDEHILMVIRNLRRFRIPRFDHEYPFLSQLMQEFDRPEVLYLAALFHDIAKGRGGDHSLLGTVDAQRFCRRHGLAREDAELVSFLVEHHLTMSSVAQKQDVDDPAVARAFAEKVGSERRLVALYLLTVADIRGTSPKVWNGWKAKLLEDLFRMARRVLAGEAPALDTAVAEKQAEATRLLRLYALSDAVKDRFWANLDTTYFLRHDAQEIAWQTRNLHYRVDTTIPVVRARLAPFGEGLQVMIYTPDRETLFARICGYFERSGFNIVEAKIHTTRNGYALDTFMVMGKGSGAHYRDLMAMTEIELAHELQSQKPLGSPSSGRVSRRVRHFPIAPAVDIRPDERGAYHLLNIVASDRPGLLYRVARQLAQYKLNLHSAKVNTLGDRAEDVFLVSGATLDDSKAVLKLEQELLAELQI